MVSTSVNLLMATIVVDSGNGIVDITWPLDDASSKTFHIDNDSIQQGKTKKVYKVRLFLYILNLLR